MRIISMVPSWTETLVEVGGDVVGRSRFCVHPREGVKNIVPVGGTKNWNIERVLSLKPDLVVLDREENVKAMSEAPGLPFHISHVQTVADMPQELRSLGSRTQLAQLNDMAGRFERVLQRKFSRQVQGIPGVVQWIRRPEKTIETIIYMIWKEPWMAVSQNTFIGSMLSLFFGSERVLNTEEKYPKIDLNNFNKENTLLLFSSEPFPFAKRPSEIAATGFPSAIVDGEKWSWFGVRSLRFLESSLFL